MSAPSRPVARKSSPSPLVRAVDEGATPRALAPVRRAAGSLAMAAAMILGAASTLSAVGCSDDRVKRDDDTRHETRRERVRSDRDGDGPQREGTTPLDQFVDAVGDLVSPEDPKEIAKPVQPPPPPTSSIIAPDPTPPRPAGGISVRRPPPPSTPPKPPAPPKVNVVGIGS